MTTVPGSDETIRALTARVMAQGSVIEVLLFSQLLLMDKDARKAFITALRNTAAQTGPPGSMSDFAAEFLADVRVRAQDSMEAMLDSVEAMLRSVSPK
jgi:hypothetical protein